MPELAEGLVNWKSDKVWNNNYYTPSMRPTSELLK
jgi:hypothetical protein